MGVKDDADLLLAVTFDRTVEHEKTRDDEMVWSSEALANELKWPPLRMNRAIELLENRALIECDPSLGSHPWSTRGFSLTAEGMEAGEAASRSRARSAAPQVSEDAFFLIGCLSELDHARPSEQQGSFDTASLAKNLGWDAPRMNRALEFLANRLLVRLETGAGTAPFQSHGVFITAEGHNVADKARRGPHSDEAASRSPEKSVPTTNLDIFISHSSTDHAVAGALAHLMRSAFSLVPERIRCTSVEPFTLDYGDDSNQLRDEVVGAKVVLGVITEQSVESAWVLFELGARWGAGKRLMAVLAGSAGFSLLPAPIGSLHSMKCEDDGKVIKLVEDVAKFLGVERPQLAAYRKDVDALLAASQAAATAASKQTAKASAKIASGLGVDDKLLLFHDHIRGRLNSATAKITVVLSDESTGGAPWSGLTVAELAAELDRMDHDGHVKVERKSTAVYVLRSTIPPLSGFVA